MVMIRVALAIDDLVDQIGIYFQIRDDYENLNSDEVTLSDPGCFCVTY